MVSPNVSIAMINGFDSTFGAVWGLMDVEAWLLLFLFTFLDWLLLPRGPSLKCCSYLSFHIFVASILNLSRMNLLLYFSCTPQHDGSLLERAWAFSKTRG